jgi:ribosome-associated protein YbcJ (S4-like RNA binding protein)
VNGERRMWYLYIPCQDLLQMAGLMGEGGIRYWAVQSGWVGVEGEV